MQERAIVNTTAVLTVAEAAEQEIMRRYLANKVSRHSGAEWRQTGPDDICLLCRRQLYNIVVCRQRHNRLGSQLICSLDVPPTLSVTSYARLLTGNMTYAGVQRAAPACQSTRTH